MPLKLGVTAFLSLIAPELLLSGCSSIGNRSVGKARRAPGGASFPVSSKTALNVGSANEGDIHIPFKLRGHEIFVRAVVGGKALDCEFDTGTSSITWPDTLGLACRELPNSASQITDAARYTVHSTKVVLPDIRVGALDVRNISSARYSATGTSKAPYELPERWLTLNASIFRNTVTTVDFLNREFIVHNRAFKPRQDARSLLMDMKLVGNDSGRDFGMPSISATVDGVPERLVLDSGCTGGDILIGTIALKRVLQARRRNGKIPGKREAFVETGFADSTRIDVLTGFELSLRESPDRAVPAWTTTVDVEPGYNKAGIEGYVGWAIIGRCQRITFDFPQSRVLLEPWPQGIISDGESPAFPNIPQQRAADPLAFPVLTGLSPAKPVK